MPARPFFPPAVGVLEGLALRDSNPRARRACAAPLAALCYASRYGGGGGAAGGSASHGAAAGGSRGFAQLPPDGALRPLLESLLEGRWVLPGRLLGSRQRSAQPCSRLAYWEKVM